MKNLQEIFLQLTGKKYINDKVITLPGKVRLEIYQGEGTFVNSVGAVFAASKGIVLIVRELA